MHLDVPSFFGVLVIVFAAAKLLGAVAQRLGQPAVLGELIAGVLVGKSVLGLVQPEQETFYLLAAEIGVVILLLEIGLETDLRRLIRLGGPAGLVAIVGVVLPFAMGYGVCLGLGLDQGVCVVAGASLTATSIGITARVLADLGRLQDVESQIILGAAVLDDILGLIILAVVEGLAGGKPVTLVGVLTITALAFGFLIAALLIGKLLVPRLFRLLRGSRLPGTMTMAAVMLAFGMAWLANYAGSALIIGSFAAGLLLSGTEHAEGVERGVAHLGHFFVPLFFVGVGAAVDVRALNPFDPDNRSTLLLGGLLIVVAVLGKFLAGYAPFWIRARKSVIGVGMIPRGEVGLIFAQTGLSAKQLTAGQFSAITVMVMVTTFLAPPLLKWLLPPPPSPPDAPKPEGIEDLVTEA
jgi:Kef-type K+ transport system membrane component KefB